MATNGTESKMRDNEMGADGVSRNDFENATKHMSHEEKQAAAKAAKFGYGPLAHMGTNAEGMLPGMQISLTAMFLQLTMGSFRR